MSDLDRVLETSGVSTAVILIIDIVLLVKVFHTINNKGCRSSCCGKSAEVAVSVTQITEAEQRSPTLSASQPKETVPPLEPEKKEG